MAGEHIVVADYVAGKMAPADRRAADAHLATCTTCRAAVAAARESRGEAQLEGAAASLITFTGRMLRGSLTLLSPSLRHLPFEAVDGAPPAPAPPRFEPLRVLQPTVVAGTRRAWRFVGRFGLVLVLTLATLLLPTPAGLSAEGHRGLAVFVFTGSILALEPVSLPIAALMVPVAQVALGVADTTTAFATFSRPVVFLILASLFLAEALRKHGLTRRLALQTMVASGGRVPTLLLGVMGIAAFFSMWVGNTATAAVLIPVALTVAKQVPEPRTAKRLLVLLVLGIAYAASVGGMATLMGAASNAVAAGFLQQIRPWSFLDWMVYGVPAFLLIFPLTWFLLLRLVRVDVDRLDVGQVRSQLQQLGGMSQAERELLGTMAVAVIFWVGGSFLESLFGLPDTLLSSAMVAVLAVSYLAIRGVLDWEDVKGVSWGIFLIIGAGLSLGEMLSRTGATEWFAGLITPIVSGPPLIVTLMLLVYLSALLTNVMNNTTIAAVFVPVLISLGAVDPAFNPVQLILPVTLATTFGYSLPSASSRMALIAATGIVGRGEMMRYGLVMTGASAGVLGLLFYGMALFGLI